MQMDVDFEVYKRLTFERLSEEDTINDVLRRMLELPATQDNQSLAWISDNYRFPEGTTFRRKYKGSDYSMEIKGGHPVLDGEIQTSFSAAAKKVTGTNCNGWNFWKGRYPGTSNYVKLDGPDSPFGLSRT